MKDLGNCIAASVSSSIRSQSLHLLQQVFCTLRDCVGSRPCHSLFLFLLKLQKVHPSVAGNALLTDLTNKTSDKN